METIKLRNSDLKVSRLCMGGCPMGGYGWGKVDEQDFIDSIHVGLESGINFFDTADTYGLGKSEETLGKALKGLRNKAIIATKFGVRQGTSGKSYYDNSPEWIETALKTSLKRLRTDYIDLYQIHYRDGVTPLETVVDKLISLKQKGYIRHFGLSNIFIRDIPELKANMSYFASFQDEYSLANRTHENDIKKINQELGFTPMTWGSLGQGILTGKYDANSSFDSDDRRSRSVYVNFHGQKLINNLKIVQALESIGKDYNKTPAAVAIRFILDHFPDSVVIAGVKNPKQLESNMSAIDWKLTQQQMKQLISISNDEGIL